MSISDISFATLPFSSAISSQHLLQHYKHCLIIIHLETLFALKISSSFAIFEIILVQDHLLGYHLFIEFECVDVDA